MKMAIQMVLLMIVVVGRSMTGHDVATLTDEDDIHDQEHKHNH